MIRRMHDITPAGVDMSYIKEQWVRIVVPGAPVPKARARVGKHGAYTPTKTKKQEKCIQQYALLAMRTERVKKMDGIVAVDIEIIQKKRRGDLDNFAKTVLDAMNQVVYTDDSVVDDLRVWRELSDDEKTIITVSESI